jgi:predicted dehydrogenase
MNIGIIGTGAMAGRLLQAVEPQAQNVSFVAAYDSDPKKLHSFSREYPHLRCYGEYSSLLGDADIDAVYIVTPVNTHSSLTIEAANNGKHVLCEKPMALTLEECQDMVSAAQKNSVILQIGYMMRFHPCHLYIRNQIVSGTLGKIRFVHLERTDSVDFRADNFPSDRMWFVDKTKSGGGAFMDLGSHLIDLCLFLVGDEVHECSLFAPIEDDLGVELSGLASLKFSAGTLATVYASWQVPLHDNLLQVYGEKASVQAIRTIGPYTDNRVELIRGDQREIVQIPHKNHYVSEFEHFEESVRNGKEPLTSGANCLKTESLRIQLFDSLNKGDD